MQFTKEKPYRTNCRRVRSNEQPHAGTDIPSSVSLDTSLSNHCGKITHVRKHTHYWDSSVTASAKSSEKMGMGGEQEQETEEDKRPIAKYLNPASESGSIPVR